MSLEYYIYCRKSYDKIIKELDYIIEMFDEIDDKTYSEININNYHDYEIFNSEQNKNFFIQRKKHIEYLRKICYDKVLNLCCHEMVRDEIDIDLYKSQVINYCSICDYTENS